ncbi:FixH family protein [Lentibacillus sp. L22]|uniref:FixH family protein n=1 Tax=Lentibacillus TaxID=175304 RepID=UPI0022B0F5DF|nr:FixH family protein [Lentibacillus daqui]
MKKYVLAIVLLTMAVLTACGNDDNNSDSDEVKMLDVDFAVPETAKVGEPVKLQATVTYGGDEVENADDVVFEYWEKGDEDNSTKVDADNNNDGTYSKKVTFDHEGVFEMYSHVDAEGLHTMPKKSITIEKK